MTSPIVIVQQPTSVLKVEGHGGLPGEQGPQGIQGIQGPSGPPGGEWQFGAGNPNGVVTGVIYNMYINTTTSDVYRSNGGTSWTFVNNIKGATGAAGSNGSNGAAGTRGSLWTSGTGVPAAANNAGDMYLRTATNIGDVYQGNGGTSWSLVGNIRGATGSTGSTGGTGPAGADGADGNPNIFYNAVTSAGAAYNTTETTIITVAGLTAGTYMVEGVVKWDSTVTSSFSLNYSGTYTGGSSTYHATRFAGAIAHMGPLNFDTLHTTSNTATQVIVISGVLVATGSGSLSLSFDNAASGTSSVLRGSFIRASK